MEFHVVFYLLLLGITGFFTAYQFGLTWLYSSEAGGREYHINVFSAVAAGLAFFFLLLTILILVAHSFELIDNWTIIYRSVMDWCVWIVSSLALIFGAWPFFWRNNEKRHEFQEFMEKVTSHFKVDENVPSTYHPYKTDFIFLDWGRPEYTSGVHSSGSSSRSSAISFSTSGSSKSASKSSSKSSKKSGKKGNNASGIFQLLILFIIVIIAALTAYALVHFIAKWAIGIEEDWIREKRGWVNSELVTANAPE